VASGVRAVKLVLISPLCIYYGGEKDMPEPVNGKVVEIIFGKIQLKSSSEAFDLLLKLFST